MKKFFMFFSVFFLCSAAFSDCLALTTYEELVAALAENLKYSAADLEKSTDQQPTLNNRDLCLAVMYHETGSNLSGSRKQAPTAVPRSS